MLVVMATWPTLTLKIIIGVRGGGERNDNFRAIPTEVFGQFVS